MHFLNVVKMCRLWQSGLHQLKRFNLALVARMSVDKILNDFH